MARFVLVHGAFSGRWCWEELTPLLEAAGHTVEAMDLPGSGSDTTPAQDVTLERYADTVCGVLSGGEPAILVGHSMGGMVITHAASKAPDDVAKLVYLCAFCPHEGASLLAMTQLPEGADDQIQANLVIEPPVGILPDDATVNAVFGNCSEEQIAWALTHHKPQALQPMADPATRGPAFDGLEKSYIVCEQDRSIPPALQRRMIREGGIERVFTLDTDHAPMLSTKTELAAILDQIAAA